MDFILNFLLELFVSGCEEGSKNTKLPRTIRIPLAIFMVIIYLLLLGFGIYALLWLYNRHMIFVMLLTVCVVLFYILSAISFIREVIKLNVKE